MSGQIQRRITEEWDQISQLIEKGYGAMERENYPAMTDNWLRAWEIVKELVKNADIKPSVSDLDEATDYEYDLMAWLEDMEMELYSAGEHEKRLRFCREILELLDWEYDDYGGYKMAIGESLYALGQADEGEVYFKEWMEEEPHNVDAINGFSMCLTAHGEAQRAYDMLKEEIGEDSCNWDNSILYVRLIEAAGRLGFDAEKEEYQKKYDMFEKETEALSENSEDFFFDDFGPLVQQPIVKPAKIYPNDPCPCGSGKKYKKCCGKNQNE